MSEPIKQFHWWTPFTTGQFWKDAIDIRPETREFVLDATDTIGQGVGNLLNPGAKAVTKPIYGLALLAVAVAATVWMIKSKKRPGIRRAA